MLSTPTGARDSVARAARLIMRPSRRLATPTRRDESLAKIEESSMKCQHCGAAVAENAAFCQACGKPLAAVAAKGGDGAPGPAPGKKAFAAATTRRRNADDDAEAVLWEGSFSKLAMIGAWVTAAAVTLGAIVIGFAAGLSTKGWGYTLLGVAAVWVFLLLRLIYLQLSVHYKLTSQRFIHERGLLWRQQDRIETIDVDDVSVQQGPVQRMLGVGTVKLTSSDRSTPEFVLVGIEEVRKVATLIDEARRNERRKRGIHIEQV
jgi:membrane protein YdbS with pleckstrin-like domain